MLRAGATQRAVIDAGGGESGGVADQLALEAPYGIDLGVELQPEQVRAARTGLIAAGRGCGEMGCAVGVRDMSPCQ